MSEPEFDYTKLLYISLDYSDEIYQKLLEKIILLDPSISIYKKTSEGVIKLLGTVQMPVEYFDPLIEKLKDQNMFIIKSDKLYKLNDKIHTTMLYTGCNDDTRISSLQPYFESTINVNINKFAISDNFIVAEIDFNSNIPYYGNSIKHVTIGLRIKNSKKFKIFPKDSPTALSDGEKFIFEKTLSFDGILKPILK